MKHVAFLRAVNVGGRYVRNADLERAFGALPVQNVATFIASGNVIFDAPDRSAARLERLAERALEETLGFDVDTFVRSLTELQQIGPTGPFTDADLAAGAALYVGFLRRPLDRTASDQVRGFSSASHEFRLVGRELFWLRRPSADPRLSGPPLEKVLGVRATFRNIRTVLRILAKFGAARKRS
ncbi:MAG TPA: DUF1697 domain-containing protein [Vicinamibacterales bacterium]|nr:DUF1697 domain-containing protein [Vicinamibacterales bacterium]